MTDKELVLSKWPKAVCWTHSIWRDMLAIYNRPYNVEMEPFFGKMLSSTFHEFEDDAWADAARQIRGEI